MVSKIFQTFGADFTNYSRQFSDKVIIINLISLRFPLCKHQDKNKIMRRQRGMHQNVGLVHCSIYLPVTLCNTNENMTLKITVKTIE